MDDSKARLESVAAALQQPAAAGAGAGAGAAGSRLVDGRFNETPLRSKPERAAALSRLLFASFGLDRFPRYLSRWDLEDVDALEAALESQLELVRLALDVKVTKCRFRSKRAQRYIRLQLFTSTFN